jgi:hypothetical protein
MGHGHNGAPLQEAVVVVQHSDEDIKMGVKEFRPDFANAAQRFLIGKFSRTRFNLQGFDKSRNVPPVSDKLAGNGV